MTCQHVKLPGLPPAIICSRGQRRKRCAACKQRAAAFECDWKVKSRESGTCDCLLCAICAFSPAPEKHLCPVHKLAYDQWLKRKEKSQEGI